MKKIALAVFSIILAILAHAQTLTSKYLPVEDQIVYKGKLLQYNAAGIADSVLVNCIPHNNSFIKLFPNILSSVSIFSVDNNGNLTVMGNGATVAGGKYHVIYDFSMFQPVNKRINDTLSLTYCVGISVRLVASITTFKANIDLSKIISLVSATASTNKFSGQIQISVKGINSQTLTNLTPIPPNGATFTADNVATELQAVAAIKSHFSDDGVIITPEVIGFYETVTSNKSANVTEYGKNVRALKTY